MSSPAHIIWTWLESAGHLNDLPLGVGESWPGTVDYMLGDESDPDECIGVFNTAGIIHGKFMEDGEISSHRGVSIHVRAKMDPAETGYTKAETLSIALAQIYRAEVVVNLQNYRIDSVTLTSDIIPLGEEETRKRKTYVVNAIVAITKL